MTGIVHFYSTSEEQKDPIIPSFPFHSSHDYEGASCAGGRYSVLSYPEKCVSEERKKERMFHFCYLFQLSYTSAKRKNLFSLSSWLKM